MGLLNRMGRMLGGGRQRGGAPEPTAMMQLLLAQNGGLHGLMKKFQQSGLGGIMGSWVSTGPNQPISPTQIQQALGSTSLIPLASRFGLDPHQLAAQLARHLPDMVDSMTPNGHLPEPGSPQAQSPDLKKTIVRH